MSTMGIPVEVGQVIRGKYRIDRVLGEGGMGIVVAGAHLGLGTKVAIKFLHAAMLAHKEVVERFAREARAASRLESDHVARVTDVDVLEDGTPFMVMEYLEGSDLSSVRASGQPLPFPIAASYLLQTCEAIGEAHRLGIVHRDIKPANLFLARRAGGRVRVKVLDFGISKMDASDAGLTRTSTVVGSAHYMSPEQMLATRDVDGRTDIWALGATLYELTTAQVPFPGDSVTQVAARVMTSPPTPPSQLCPGLPPELDSVVMRCLERDLSRRIGSIDELVQLLAPLASQGAAVAAAPGPADPRRLTVASSPGGTAALPHAIQGFASASEAASSPLGPGPSDGTGNSVVMPTFPTQGALSTTMARGTHIPTTRSAFAFVVGGLGLLTAIVLAGVALTSAPDPAASLTRGRMANAGRAGPTSAQEGARVPPPPLDDESPPAAASAPSELAISPPKEPGAKPSTTARSSGSAALPPGETSAKPATTTRQASGTSSATIVTPAKRSEKPADETAPPAPPPKSTFGQDL